MLHVCVLSCVWLFVMLWTVALQTPLSREFSRQDYWSGLPFPPPGESSQPRERTWYLASPALTGKFLTTKPPGKPRILYHLPFDCDFVNFSLYFLKKRKLLLYYWTKLGCPHPFRVKPIYWRVMKENAAFILGVK